MANLCKKKEQPDKVMKWLMKVHGPPQQEIEIKNWLLGLFDNNEINPNSDSDG